MKVIEIYNQEQLNNFLASQKYSQFLQSWQWKEFQESRGNRAFVIGIEDNGQLVASALLIKFKIGLGQNYLYCPRGPIISAVGTDGYLLKQWLIFWQKFIEIAHQEKSLLIKIEPPVELILQQSQILEQSFPQNIQKSKFKQPADFWVLDLGIEENQILKNMHSKTRYNIQLAEKKGVKIFSGNGKKEYEYFWQLLNKTYSRKNIRTYPKNYYWQILKQTSKGVADESRLEADKNKLGVRIYYAKYNDEVLAANFVTFFGDTVVYLHGGTSDKYRHLMSPQLLQWKTIQDAKKCGYKYYDFYGVVPKREFFKQDQILRTGYLFGDNHPSNGYTRFKHGFGGREVNFIGTFDIVVKKFWYQLYKLMKTKIK